MVSISQLLYYSADMIMPISYDEACLAVMGMTYDELVEYAYSLEDTTNLPDGINIEDWVLSEIHRQASLMDVTIMSEQDIENFYNKSSYSKRGTLILGGDNSKFIIPNNTNVSNMFGKGCDFKSIILPNVIGDGVNIELVTNYYDGSYLVTNLTSNNSGQVLELYVDQELKEIPQPTRRPISKILIIALCVCGGITLLVVIPVVRANIKKRKSFQRSIWMSTRQ